MKTNERVVIDKNQPYEYNIAVYILQELCSEGIIDIFDLSEALIKLRKLYNLPVIGIFGKKGNHSHYQIFGECLCYSIYPSTIFKHEPCIIYKKGGIASTLLLYILVLLQHFFGDSNESVIICPFH